MENILGVGSITITDLNDALISGDAPRNPDEGALWIDSSAKKPVLKVYKNGLWQPQEIDVNNLDPKLSETVSTIVNTLGTLANDGLLTYADRLQLSVEIASIIGEIPSKQNGNVYPNTLPAYDTIDSRGVGSFSNLRQTARDATVPTDNEYYIALEDAYKDLNTYLSSLTPRPWDVTLANKDKNTEVANPDTYRESLLNYYLAEMNLATYTEKRATEAAKEYTDTSVQDIEIGGRNLFSVNQYVSLRNSEGTTDGNRYSTGSSGAMVVDGVDGSSGYDTMKVVDLKANTEYIFTYNIPINDMFSFYDTDGVAVSVDKNWSSDNTQLKFKMGNVDGYIGGKFCPVEQSYPVDIYLMAEKGNTATDWTEAPEDTDKKIMDGMEEVSTAVNAAWTTEADSIRGDVEATYVTANDFAELKTEVSTSFTQTEKDFEFKFTESKELVSNVEGNIETLENEIKKYIRFVDGTIILGAEGSTSEVIISNEKISFMQGGEDPVAFIEGQKMQINHGIFVDSATIAGFKFELVPGTTDVLGITWTDN